MTRRFRLAIYLTVLALAWSLGGCASTPAADPSAPLPAITDEDVADARSQLTKQGISASELAEACEYYAANAWSFIDAWNATYEGEPTRMTDVVTDISMVVEGIAVPADWATSVAENFDRPLDEWTEADHLRYEKIIVARKRELLEPLCSR